MSKTARDKEHKAVTVRSAPVPRALPSIGLALGGGGARGLAHILMLEVFDELGLRPSIIAGTSIGALYGAAYAAGLPAREIRELTEKALGRRLDLVRLLIGARAEPILKLLRILPVRRALLNPEQVLAAMLPSSIPLELDALGIPLQILATDFYEQEQVVLTQGPLRSAVAASIALPALFSPVIREGRVLMDGGLVNPLPFDILRGQAELIVAIDVSGASTGPGQHLQPTPFNAIISSSQILQRSIVREKLKAQQPDVYIDVDVGEYSVLDFHRYERILASAVPAQEKLRRQLKRILTSHPAETLPMAQGQARPEAARPTSRLGRLRGLKRGPK
ncbi:MAG: patatin-like phospholipase family protein [Hyphomicrobiaceae bacterium]|nr:patatin-like phospholipase family protein [Hyphomicrobiaceae bacterium]